ncbi:histidine phosphatase family protein [Roseisolibacter sp. H3M3-2]|uniref:histidine phosphatase family protein n=1 Tax=Roseisolibacter sp. H3M3-2 TaxID=3031323 RepID=UPI0023DAC8BE|nr:histidine phosphatase family protein [Roseisolibacter sp. H3M3-2]MDF1504312.1 histidine phosphatase family protein [Roseisolibacter sp. H3M3-2]
MSLLLIRHGRSAHPPPSAWLDRDGITRWLADYDRAGIHDDDAPPPALVDEVRLAAVLAASDMPRALASAARLCPGREVACSPLVREVGLPIPAWLPGRAPLAVWALGIHATWIFDLARRRAEPAEVGPRVRERAARCAARCAAADGGTVAVVTHGVMRRLLARELAAAGWRGAPGRRSYAHWSVWRMAPP